MLYKKKNEAHLSPELFKEPTAEFRAAPFWAWNCELNKDLLEKEIEYMKDMGFGGYHIHPRVGFATPYLSDEYMDLVKACIEKGRKEDMLTYLYDEDKWPSGYAGGFNTKDIEHRQKMIFMTLTPYDDGTLVTERDKANSTKKLPESKYIFVACHDVLLNEEYKLVSYKRINIEDDVPEGHDKMFSYIEYAITTPGFNNQSYCDTLSKETIESFINITHEAYKKNVGDEFNKLVPSIFTDEPNFRPKRPLAHANDRTGAIMPYTTDFKDSFIKAYGFDIEDHLPTLVWENADGTPSRERYLYHDHVAERFASAFCDTIGEWCNKNDILMTGHLLEEATLSSQSFNVGDAMRGYRGFTLPGIDMLCDHQELTTAKQAQSAAHQYGREGVMSELYGVTNWNFDFRGHLLQGNWQAALGVTLRVPHLFWVSMKGEAKRDYPASIGYQSPWYKEYKHIEDHFARINTVMTRGTPDVKIGVIHPVESLWLCTGPNDQTISKRNSLDSTFEDLTSWLLNSMYDFDFICEATLPDQHKKTDVGFNVGEMTYDTIVVPPMDTIRKTTLDALREFSAHGGKVILLGNAPKCVDAVLSSEPKEFFDTCTVIPFERGEIYSALDSDKFIDIAHKNGRSYYGIIHQVRNDGDKKNVFICNLEKARNYDVAPVSDLTVTINGEWSVDEYETMSGEKRHLAVYYKDGKTMFNWLHHADASLLLELTPGKDESGKGFVFEQKEFQKAEYPSHAASFKLSEPNVLLLDKAEFSVNGGDWHGETEIIKANQIIRTELGLQILDGHMAQPWLVPIDKDPKAKVSLRYTFDSDIEYQNARLALETPEYVTLTLNGEPVDMTVNGWYIDEDSIKTVTLPTIKKGTNVLVADLRVGDATSIEAMYLLGDFGIEHHGYYSKLTSLPEKLYFDNITSQGLPFYGANIEYTIKFNGGGKKHVEVSKYRGATIKVILDGKTVGYIDTPPHRLYLGELEDKEHTLTLVYYGTRMNTLGQLHNVDDNIPWANSRSWKVSGRFFTNEYMLYPQGIMTAPRILTE